MTNEFPISSSACPILPPRRARQAGNHIGEFVAEAPELPDKYKEQRYVCMVHGAGLEDEGPTIFYPEDYESDGQTPPEREIEENMVLSLECYAGELGGAFGVKLEDQVLVTQEGADLLSTYPYDEKLLS